MTDSLGSLLTSFLQLEGISSDDYYKLSDAVYTALHKIDAQISKDQYVVFPNGNIYRKETNVEHFQKI